MTIEVSLEGMRLDQVITMLQAAQAQGATHVALGMRTREFGPLQSDIEWLSMSPIDEGGVQRVYLGAMLEQGEWQHMGNEAAASLDW